MRTAFAPTLLSVSIIAVFTSSTAFATNGLAPIGLGQIHKAMGGAAAGNPQNTMSMATNPASAAFIDDGWDVGLELFVPDRSASISGSANPAINATYDANARDTFLIPEIGYKRTINDKFSWGVVAYGNGGMNTSYTTPVPLLGTTNAGVDLAQLFIAPTVSMKVGENHSFGASLNLVYQQFKAKGIENFGNPNFSVDPNDLANAGSKDSSTGVGLTIGWQGKFSDSITAGVSYRAKTSMSKFKKYDGLFPEGKFDVPAAWTAGIGVQATPKTLIAADIERIEYSKVDAIGNSPALLFQGRKMGSANGPGFGWDDQTVFKIGVKQQIKPNLALMAGYNHGKNPVKASDTLFNMLAPGIVEDHLTLGAEWKVSNKSKVTVSYVHSFEKKLEGNLSIPPSFGGGDADIKMSQNAIGIGYSVKF